MAGIIVIAYPMSDDKLRALMAFMNELHIKFEVRKTGKSPYNPEYVDMILQGDKDIEAGKGEKITIEDLNEFYVFSA